MSNLKVGVKSKKSCRMSRAVIVSPPVSALILVSSHFRPFCGFLRCHQAGADKPGDIGRVLLVAGFDECFHCGGRCVVAQDGRDRLDQRAFAVGAAAVGKDEGMFVGLAGQRIAEKRWQKAIRAGSSPMIRFRNAVQTRMRRAGRVRA